MSRKIPLEAEVRKNAKISEGFYIPNGDKQNVPEEADHYILKHVNKCYAGLGKEYLTYYLLWSQLEKGRRVDCFVYWATRKASQLRWKPKEVRRSCLSTKLTSQQRKC